MAENELLSGLRLPADRAAAREATKMIASKAAPLVITMPCGYVTTYTSPRRIPRKDTPCPCGDSAHWIVTYGPSAPVSAALAALKENPDA